MDASTVYNIVAMFVATHRESLNSIIFTLLQSERRLPISTNSINYMLANEVAT